MAKWQEEIAEEIDEDLSLYQVLNLNRADLIRMEKSSIEASTQWKAKQFTPSQQRHWKEAARLIREGCITSYADLGPRFPLRDYERQKTKRETYTAEWAYLLVNKLILRRFMTKDEVQRLIANTTSPFKKQSTNKEN